MLIPTSLIFLILGIIGLIIYFFLQKKNQSKFNKSYLFLGVILILLGVIPGVLLSLQNKNFDDFKTHPTENVAANGFDNKQMEKAISNYLLTEKHFSWKNREDSHSFCTIENLKPNQELFPLYIWAYCGEYIIEDNTLKTVSGSSGPVKINYPNELSYYDLSKFSYEAPRDGSDYSKDIKIIFPKDVQQKIFEHNVEDLIERAENHAFTNISNWNAIKQAIARCEIKSVMQTHTLEVRATLKKDDKMITAQEPKIDDIFDIVNQYKNKCSEVIIATE